MMLIKIPNSKYSLDFQHGVSCSVYRNYEYCADLSGLNIIYDMADYINNLLEDNTALEKRVQDLLEENDNLKETIHDLERENKNSFTSGYNHGFDAGIEQGYTSGCSACSNNESGF